MDSLQNLLSSSPRDKQPPQVQALKDYAKEKYGVKIGVSVQKTFYRVSVPNAAIAQNFRFDAAEISKMCSLDKKLAIQISD